MQACDKKNPPLADVFLYICAFDANIRKASDMLCWSTRLTMITRCLSIILLVLPASAHLLLKVITALEGENGRIFRWVICSAKQVDVPRFERMRLNSTTLNSPFPNMHRLSHELNISLLSAAILKIPNYYQNNRLFLFLIPKF